MKSPRTLSRVQQLTCSETDQMKYCTCYFHFLEASRNFCLGKEKKNPSELSHDFVRAYGLVADECDDKRTRTKLSQCTAWLKWLAYLGPVSAAHPPIAFSPPKQWRREKCSGFFSVVGCKSQRTRVINV